MNGASGGLRLPGWVLAGLVLALPFEPRRPVLQVMGLGFTLLELAAAAAIATLAWSARAPLLRFARRPPLPVVCLAAFACVHFLSALAAPANGAAAAVYSLRMAAAAVFAAVVAACPRRDLEFGLRALLPMAALVAGLAILERSGLRALDPFLNLFREASFAFDGVRRASAASENPNLAAALLADGLIASAGFVALAAAPARRALALALPFSLALLSTSSRGGFLASLVGTLVVILVLRPGLHRAGLAVVTTVVAATLGGVAADPALRNRVAVERLATSHRASYQPSDTALLLAPGEVREVTVRVKNTGSGAWQPEAYHVVCAWFRDDSYQSAGCRTRLPGPVAPGASVLISAAVRAPARSGGYFLVWDMVGTLGRFSGLGVPPGVVAAAVGGVAAPAGAPWLVSRGSRWELWKLAGSMWRSRPLLGFGPDNFRKLHAAFGGWYSEREARDAAHSVYMETAASTGGLGLLSLLATLLAAFRSAGDALRRSAARADRVAPAVVLGLLAGFAAHGLVDHLLGFTAQYLLLGLLVGASAGLAAPRALSASTAAA